MGKIKEKYLVDLINDYKTRISKYHPIQIIEVADSTIEEEKNSLLKYIKEKDYVIGLDLHGKMLSSEEFAKKIDTTFISYSVITFVIGGSLGIHEDFKKKCNELISFSSLTFPHGLFRGILLEQIYRSFKINHHESYHK